jgi:hypothetical protein
MEPRHDGSDGNLSLPGAPTCGSGHGPCRSLTHKFISGRRVCRATHTLGGTHFTAEEAITLMDEGGIDAAVIHPPDWDPDATELAFRAVRDYPGRFAIMGTLPLDDPGTRARIAGWRRQSGMLGLRYSFLTRLRGFAPLMHRFQPRSL